MFSLITATHSGAYRIF